MGNASKFLEDNFKDGEKIIIKKKVFNKGWIKIKEEERAAAEVKRILGRTSFGVRKKIGRG